MEENVVRQDAAAAVSIPSERAANPDRPRIMLVVSRGEAVRNFLYSDTLQHLAEHADVSLLSVVYDSAFAERFSSYVKEIIPLREWPPPPAVSRLRHIIENAHDRWLWSAVARNNAELRDRRAATPRQQVQRAAVKTTARALAWEPILRGLTKLEQQLVWRFRPTRQFDDLIGRLRPHLVFNCSHIHGAAGELPLRIAARKGVPTAGFIFSWDNLTSRSRIFVPYDHYLVWHEPMKRQLLDIYPWMRRDHVHVTGTPQFDFHFDTRFQLSREELCAGIGIDPSRPYVLYTSGIANHFLEEHEHVRLVIRLLRDIPGPARPQLVVRTYAKGTSAELRKLAAERIPDVVFPKVAWDEVLQVPQYEDLAVYSSLLRHCALGINAASTVTLELLMMDKPVINLDFDPPGIALPWCLGYSRHIRFDHFQPVADSGATMVAKSEDDMSRMLTRGLSFPAEDAPQRRQVLVDVFGGEVPRNAGQNVAHALLRLASA